MTVDHFKKGPPDLYRDKQFKSFLKGSKKNTVPNVNPSIKTTKSIPKTVKSCPLDHGLNKQPIQNKRPPERKFASQAVKSFDEQIIPALRGKSNICSEAFEVSIAKNQTTHRAEQSKFDVPNTPMKKLLLKLSSDWNPGGSEEKENEIFKILEQRVEDSDFSVSNSSVQKLLDGDDLKVTHTARRLGYNENQEECENGKADLRQVEAAVMRKGLTDYMQQLPWYENVQDTEKEREFPCFRELQSFGRRDGLREDREPPSNKPANTVNVNLKSEISEHPKRSHRDIAEAMKRKGLTDNVKKHLAWNSTPRKRRPVCIVKKIKIKKPKPPKREKLNLHELKDKLNQLEDVKNKLQQENNRIKRIEKDYLDEKIKLDKQRKQVEKLLQEEKQKIAEERAKLLDDQKKFKREKSAFESYHRETRSLPTREEREEIKSLKEEIEKLKESQKTKEARVGAAQAQLRNQIVLLRRENNELKKELEGAKKVTVKKVSFDTDGVVKGKVISALNKQISCELKKWIPISARERPSERPALLRRTKSHADLKMKPKVVKTRTRGASSGPVGEYLGTNCYLLSVFNTQWDGGAILLLISTLLS